MFQQQSVASRLLSIGACNRVFRLQTALCFYSWDCTAVVCESYLDRFVLGLFYQAVCLRSTAMRHSAHQCFEASHSACWIPQARLNIRDTSELISSSNKIKSYLCLTVFASQVQLSLSLKSGQRASDKTVMGIAAGNWRKMRFGRPHIDVFIPPIWIYLFILGLSWWLLWLGVGLMIERSLVQLPARALSSQLGQLSPPSLRGR